MLPDAAVKKLNSMLDLDGGNCYLTPPFGNSRKKEVDMKKYVCKICGYVYDPAENNNVPFEELPEDWTCPICGVGKDQFEEA